MTGFFTLGYGQTHGLQRTTTVRIPAASVATMFTTPVTLVPAAAAGMAIVPSRVTIRHDAGTGYTVGGTSDFAVKYTNASGQQIMSTMETTGFMDQTTAQIRSVTPIAATGTTAADITPVPATPVVLQTLAANITGGSYDLIVSVSYSLVNTNF